MKFAQRFLLLAGCALLNLAAPVHAADQEYLMARDVTIAVSGQTLNLASGQKVSVIMVANGQAAIRATLPNGSVTIVQTPIANLTKPAAPIVAKVPAVTPPAAPTPPPALAKTAVASATKTKTKTKAEVDALIDQVGKTKPDWWDATAAAYPPTLDLTWKSKPGDPQTNIGAYIWHVVDPNPSKWKGAVKMLHDSLKASKDDPTATKQAESSLTRLYVEMLGDFARGAFWAQKAGNNPVSLAVCYLKLGCPSAAVDLLTQMGSDQTRNGQAIKLWAELGQLDKARQWADEMASGNPTVAYLAAGDACRLFGRTAEAQAYYEKVLAVNQSFGRDDPVNKKRAAASIEAIKLFDSLDLTKIPDGTYKDSSIGYVGPVTVAVTVKNHKIEDVKVTDHHEKQFYSSITDVPPQIVAKQSVTGIATSTGATVTSEAIINASAKALAGAH